MEKIEIIIRHTKSGKATAANSERYTASFEPVRTIEQCTIGWATVTCPTYGDELRFPAIVDRRNHRVLTVGDWQSHYDTDLSDPLEVARQTLYGVASPHQGGAFYTATGAQSDTAHLFVRGDKLENGDYEMPVWDFEYNYSFESARNAAL